MFIENCSLWSWSCIATTYFDAGPTELLGIFFLMSTAPSYSLGKADIILG